jgi:SlyX protein
MTPPVAPTVPTNTAAAATEQRLTELEIKASFAEDLLEQLNHIIVRQQQHITQLAQAVQQLRQQQAAPGQSEVRNLRDELPPHY